MDLYKCDTFNLVLCDLLLTQTDRRSEGERSRDTDLCVRTYRDPLLTQVALVDKGHTLFNTSLAALFTANIYAELSFSPSQGSCHDTYRRINIKMENQLNSSLVFSYN